jgi:hypothetical protein
MKHLLNNLTEEEKNSIRNQHTGGINVVTENFSKLINAKSGEVKPLINEQISSSTTSATTQVDNTNVKTITNKVASEGIKNVTPEMMSSPQFKGQYSGYVFGGVFNGINYEWDCNDVPGMSGVRGMVQGEIISETSKNMFTAIKKYPGDNNPESPCVGFYSKNGSFIIYTTSDGKTNCINF